MPDVFLCYDVDGNASGQDAAPAPDSLLELCLGDVAVGAVPGFVPVARRGPVHYLVLRDTHVRAGRGVGAGPRAALAVAALGVAAVAAWRRCWRRP